MLYRVPRPGSFTSAKRSQSHELMRKRRHLVVQKPIILNDNARNHCCSWILRRSLTSQVISVAYYTEVNCPTNFVQRPKFRLEVLLRAVNLWHGTSGFTFLPKEIILRIFTLWKYPSTPAGCEHANLGSSGEYDNHWTTGVDARSHTVAIYLTGI